MDSMRGQGGIQMLLTAEQEAQHTVSAAKNLKMTRLKLAKDEVEEEAALFRSHMESDHSKKLSEMSGNSDSTVKQLEEETALKIKKLKESASKVQTKVVGMLMKHVTTIKY